LGRAVKSIPQRKQDYAAAKKLLADAGHPNGFSATLTTENFLEIPQYAEFIQQQLKPAGINVTLNVEDQNTYYGSGDNQPWLDVPFGIVDWAPRGYPGQTITPAYLCKGVWNTPHWCDTQYDSTIAQLGNTLNPAKRSALALSAAKIQYDEVPAIIAYWIKELRATRKNVHGVPKGPAAHIQPSGVWIG
jgi:peptide/nickel transport system substrate-binding protein